MYNYFTSQNDNPQYFENLSPVAYASFVMNTGVWQDLFKKKMSVILTVSDIFKTLQQKNGLNTAYLKQVSIGKRDAQVIYLGISYRFGKTIKKQPEKKLQFDDNL